MSNYELAASERKCPYEMLKANAYLVDHYMVGRQKNVREIMFFSAEKRERGGMIGEGG